MLWWKLSQTDKYLLKKKCGQKQSTKYSQIPAQSKRTPVLTKRYFFCPTPSFDLKKKKKVALNICCSEPIFLVPLSLSVISELDCNYLLWSFKPGMHCFPLGIYTDLHRYKKKAHREPLCDPSSAHARIVSREVASNLFGKMKICKTLVKGTYIWPWKQN